jgi:transposase-like protein
MPATKLTQAVRGKLLEHIRAGQFINAACKAAGIDDSTFRRWRDAAAKGTNQRAASLFAEINQIEEDLKKSIITRIRDLAYSNVKVEKKVVVVEKPDGSTETTTTETTCDQFDLRALQWFLSRRWPEWAQQIGIKMPPGGDGHGEVQECPHVALILNSPSDEP